MTPKVCIGAADEPKFATIIQIDLLCKSHNAPVPYPTMHHLGYLANALWDLWEWVYSDQMNTESTEVV